MNAKILEGVNKNPTEGRGNTRESALRLGKRLRTETKNLLEVKTPKECVAGYEKIISIIKAQIEANNTELEEIKAQLPSSKEKKEIYKKTVEEFSIKRLSKFLSDEELEIIKKGREYSELNKIIEEGMVDHLEDLIKKIFEGIKNLTDEEKFIIAEYLGSKQIILIDMNQYEVRRGFTISVGFYYTDFADKMDEAREVQRNLRELGLDHFVYFVGDSCYRLDYELYGSARKKVKEENFFDIENSNQEKFDKLQKKGEKLERKLENLEERKMAVEKYGFPEKEAISLYKWSENLYEKHDEVRDKKNHVCVVLHEYSDYIPGCGGSEYGTVISIKRGKNTTKKSFKYRDRYGYENDNPRHEYKKINGIKVNGDKVEVTVSNGEYIDTYEFDIAYKEPEKQEKSENTEKVKNSVSVDKKVFEKLVKQKEGELISRYTKNLEYPIVCEKENHTLVSETIKLGGHYVPYDKPEVVYEKINLRSGKACIVIKAQIDTDFEAGKQFRIVKCVINSKGETIDREEYNYWQYQIIEDPEGVNKKINSLKRIG